MEPLRDFVGRFFRKALLDPDNLRDFLMDAVPALAAVRMEKEELVDFQTYFQEACGKLGSMSETRRVRWTQMIQLIFGWVFHRRPRQERQIWIDLGAAAQKDELHLEELKAMAQALGKTIYEEGMEDQARLTLLVLGRKRFGEPPTEIVLTLQQIENLDRFDRMTLRMLEVSSWG